MSKDLPSVPGQLLPDGTIVPDRKIPGFGRIWIADDGGVYLEACKTCDGQGRVLHFEIMLSAQEDRGDDTEVQGEWIPCPDCCPEVIGT